MTTIINAGAQAIGPESDLDRAILADLIHAKLPAELAVWRELEDVGGRIELTGHYTGDGWFEAVATPGHDLTISQPLQVRLVRGTGLQLEYRCQSGSLSKHAQANTLPPVLTA